MDGSGPPCSILRGRTCWRWQVGIAVLRGPLLADVLDGGVARLVVPVGVRVGVQLDTALGGVVSAVGLAVPFFKSLSVLFLFFSFFLFLPPVREGHGGPVRPLVSVALVEVGQPDPVVVKVVLPLQETCRSF